MILDKYDVLGAELAASGEIRLKLGDAKTGKGVVDDVALWGTDGFVSMPEAAEDGEACSALYVRAGNLRRAIGTKDNRTLSKYGDLKPGDKAIVSSGDARVIVKRATHTIDLFTLNSDDGSGSPVMLQVSGKQGSITALAAGNGGTAMLKIKAGKIALAVDGGGSLLVNAQGVTVNGKHFAANTATGNLGTIAGAPPQPGVNSILAGLTGMTGVPSAGWTISPA